MAKPFRVSEYFNLKDISPSSLQQDNLITFFYQSPNGVHDKNPLCIVVEKRLDRIFAFNLHYDMSMMQECLENADFKIKSFVEKEWYRKYPKKRQELKENRQKFATTLINEKDLMEIVRRIPKKDLEQFLIENTDMIAFRCYLYKRMNKVSKLTWRTDIKVMPGTKDVPAAQKQPLQQKQKQQPAKQKTSSTTIQKNQPPPIKVPQQKSKFKQPVKQSSTIISKPQPNQTTGRVNVKKGTPTNTPKQQKPPKK
jgi:hypothetical protein